jgi:hypothetical protein
VVKIIVRSDYMTARPARARLKRKRPTDKQG